MEKIKSLLILLSFISICGHTKGQDVGYHEFRFGIGAYVLLESMVDDNGRDIFPLERYSEIYQGDRVGTPAISLSYSYQFKNWFAFGATFNYAGVFQKRYDLYSDAVYSKHSWNFIGLTPTVRFDWFRLKVVKFYSSVGVGLGYDFARENIVETGRKYTDGFCMPTLDLVPLGMTVGRKVFGFCEMGVSTHGFVKAGVGYRLNHKSRKQV